MILTVYHILAPWTMANKTKAGKHPCRSEFIPPTVKEVRMHYATSDLHGFPLTDFLRLLDKAGFSEDDELYVLGDVIDRNGDGGVEMLRWMMRQPNVTMLLGNHEAMLLGCDFFFNTVTDESLDAVTPQQAGLLAHWMRNGAEPTLQGLKTLLHSSPDEFADLLDYLRDAPLYEALSLPEGDFLLTHAGLGNFHPGKKISAYTPDDLLWHRPAPDEKYFDTITTVFGHTPTGYLDPSCNRRMLRTPTWIDIDTGASSGHSPMLLCLETLEPVYFDN